MSQFFDEPTFHSLVSRCAIQGPTEDAVRRRVERIGPSGGWTSLAPDPMKLLRYYRTLKMKPGWVLKAYQLYSNGNGYCLVFAWPKGAPLPEPYDVQRLEERDSEWTQPCPAGSVEDFMRVVDGDGSPESFLMASFFRRYVASIGAYWHSAGWHDDRVLFANPVKREARSGDEYDPFAHAEWTVRSRLPRRFEPRVQRSHGVTEVVFHTYCPIGWQAVTRYVDRFTGEGMSFSTEDTLLATAPGGMVH